MNIHSSSILTIDGMHIVCRQFLNTKTLEYIKNGKMHVA